MPKHDDLYMRKTPHLQIKILKSIALNGRLSQKEAAAIFRCKPPTISEAFKIMTNKRLIEITTAPDLERKIRQEKFYKLSAQGLSTFIKEDPTSDEFWVAMIWYGAFNSESTNKEFNAYYNQFIHRFIGDNALRSCFFLGNFFENLFLEWRKDYFESRQNPIAVYNYTEAVKAYKVLECLLLNRGITVEEIVKSTALLHLIAILIKLWKLICRTTI
jgi:DNA-binding MarR family transcriptional regulator